MNETESKFEYPFTSQLLLKLGGLGMMVLGSFLFRQVWNSDFDQVILILFGSFFMLLGFMGIMEGFKIILVSSEGIIQKTWLNKIEISQDDVKGFAEIYHPNSKGVQVELIVFSKTDQKIKIYKEGWGDQYELLLKKIKSRYKKVRPEVKKELRERRKKTYKNIGKGFGICLFLFGLYQSLFPSVIRLKELPGSDGTYSEQFPTSFVLLMMVGIGIFLFYHYISKGHD